MFIVNFRNFFTESLNWFSLKAKIQQTAVNNNISQITETT